MRKLFLIIQEGYQHPLQLAYLLNCAIIIQLTFAIDSLAGLYNKFYDT